MSTLRDSAAAVRRDIVTMIDAAQLGHIGGDLSVTDILVTLFGAVLDVDPEHPDRPDRDRFVLSKGHCAAALYATLAHCGFFPRKELNTFMAPLSTLNGHPDRKKVPGVETNTGPLGHGFPVAVGCALAAKLRGASWRTFVVMGDGEMQEGSNWEAAMTAAALRAREHHRRRRPQPPPAGRAHGGDQAPGPARTTSGRASAGRSARSTATTTERCSTRSRRRPPASPSPSSPTRSRARASRSSRTAWSGITRSPTAEQVAGRARGARTMTAGDQRRADLRLPQGVRRAAHRARTRGRPDRRRLQRLRRLEQPRRLPRGASPTGCQRRHRRAGPRRRRRRTGQRRPDPVRLRRRPVPDRTGAGADQGRRRLQRRST